MRNTLFSGLLLLGTAGGAAAQTVIRTAPATTINSINTVSPAIATTTGYGYSYNDRQINDADLKTKEINKEISVPKGGDIYIENSSRGIVVKTWDQQKVKVTTTVYYEGESKLTDEEWLEKVNLSLKTLGSSVKIKSGSVNSGSFYSYNGPSGSYSYGGGSVAIFDAAGQNIGVKNNLKRVVTITVPAGSKLDIESKYADVQLPASIGDVNVDISNGNLEADNINKLILRAKYSNANVGDIKTAELEFTNGRFSAKNIDDLDIESKYSTIEMAAARKMVMRSTNDEYELEEAGEIRGRKNYGNLRITKLNNSLELDGTNADVKIRNVGPALTLIKLDNKYADVRIPLRNNKNYQLDFSGAYSSVYGNFEKVPVIAIEKAGAASSSDVAASSAGTVRAAPEAGRVTVATGRLTPLRALTPSGWNEGNGPSRFTATVGDGKGLKIDMKCQNCTVDFK